MLTRRQVLTRGAAGGLGLALARGMTLPVQAATPGLAKFVDPLPVPGSGWPVIDLRSGGAATIPVRQASFKVHRDLPATPMWAYGNGGARSTFLGPTLLVEKDVPVNVTFRNELPAKALLPADPRLVPAGAAPVRINTHLHGGHISDSADGNPYFTPVAAEVTPGGGQTKAYENSQAAALLFYHDHALGITRTNVYAGMAGGYLIHDSAEDSLNLPGGAFDVPLILQDRTFTKGGALAYPGAWAPEFFGDTALVNGRAWPFMNVQPRKYRLRLLNGSNSRFYHLRFNRPVTIHQIGGELGLLPAPVRVTSILIAPGERADVVIDFRGQAGQRVVMSDIPLPAGTVSPTRPLGDVMQFRVGAGTVTDPSTLPSALGGSAPSLVAGTRRYLTLDEVLGRGGKPVTALINNTHFHHPDGNVVAPTETPALGATEQWDIINLTADTHPIHVHLVHLQVVERQTLDVAAYMPRLDAARAAGDPGTVLPPAPAELIGAPVRPPAWERGRKDTVRANPGEVTRIRATFDRPGKYVYHCHILEHEDNDMMRPFLVG